MIDELLKASRLKYVFHATRIKHIESIASAGVILGSAFRETNNPGSKKDVRGGGGKFVYCRVVMQNSPTKIGQFGTRSSLKDAVYFVMPVEKLKDYSWFVSSVDLNGKLPTGMKQDDIEQSETSKIGTLKGMVPKRGSGTMNSGNFELGLYQAMQLCDVSHLVLSAENAAQYDTQLVRLVHSIQQMKMAMAAPNRISVSDWVKVRRSKDGENAYRVIANGTG